MAQSDYNVENADGATVRADINSQLEAIATQNSGSEAPDPTFPNMPWFDTSTNELKHRNDTNTAWITFAKKEDGEWIPYSRGAELGEAANMGTTASRTSSSTTLLLQAAAMNAHRTSADHDSRYVRISNLGNELASLSLGAVGTYAMMRTEPLAVKGPGDTASGSNLIYTSASGGLAGWANTASGTWMACGRTNDSNSEGATTTWKRIA